MTHAPQHPSPPTAVRLIDRWLQRQLAPAARDWWQGAQAAAAGGGERALYLNVSLASRRLGKAALELDADDGALARQSCPGWQPAGWTVDQAARVALLLLGGGEGETFVRRLDQLCATADVDELVALHRGLPLYPEPHRHRARAGEGLRSNMRVVFEAVALDNPYPAAQFDDDAWNQMVLKALFVGAPLHRVAGLDQRANARLARMLCDYAHERWAAGRAVAPDLWRCVGPQAEGSMLDDLGRVLDRGTPAEQAAAVLALRGNGGPAAAALLARHERLAAAVQAQRIAWDTTDAFTGPA